MNDPKQKETQQELFEQFSGEPKKTERFPQLTRSHKPVLLSTNVEQLIMGGILTILVLCGVFFLGVIRGKSLSRAILEPSHGTAEPAASVPAASPAPRQAVAVTPKPPSRAPAVPRAVAQPVASAPLPSKPYTIQLVTHRKKELAENEMNSLREAGFYAFLIPSGEYFQVCVGQYASKDEAKKDLSRFMARFKDCFLRRR